MALFETWHVGLLERALSKIEPSPRLTSLLAAMDETRRLSARAAAIYGEHPAFSKELATIQQRQSALADDVGRLAASADAPSCASLVVLP